MSKMAAGWGLLPHHHGTSEDAVRATARAKARQRGGEAGEHIYIAFFYSYR